MIKGKTDVFHWHQDTFDLPEGSLAVAGSEACPNQGFAYNKRVLGLQFHPEITKDSAGAFFEECGQGLGNGPYVQSSEEILSNDQGFDQSAGFMTAVLETMEKV